MGTQNLLAATGPIERLAHWAGNQPEAIALIGNNGIRTSYGSLWHNVQARAAWLHASGVQAAQTVALSLPIRTDEWATQVELLYATAYLGAAVLPLYHDVPATRWASLMTQFDAHWLVADELPPNLDGIRHLNPVSFEASAHPPGDGSAPRGDAPAQAFLYEFTSGTTGSPKTVLFSAEKYTAMILVSASQYGWLQSDVMVTPVRWPTKVGIKGLVRALILGATFADAPFPETRDALHRLVSEVGVTSLGASPWQLRRLLASQPAATQTPAQLRLLSTAGAYISPHDIQSARDSLTPNVHVGYGTTEIGTMAHLGPDDPANAPMRVVPGMQVQVTDAQGCKMAVGQPGRLRFRAPWMLQSYAGPAHETVEAFHKGWFITSDFGSVDAQGRLILGGRVDNIVNYGGIKISPRDVEGALLAMPGIADAALVGIADAMAGELPVAFMVLKWSLALGDIHAHLLTQLDPNYLPIAIVATREIPRNPEGKVLKAPLRALYAQLTQHHSRSKALPLT